MGTTFEEQQAAREEYQAKVRESREGAKPVGINPTHETPNPEENENDDISEVSDAKSEVSSDEEPVSESEEGGEEASPEKPSHSDKKAEWVAYAAKLTGESEEDINEKHTKEDLVAKFG